MPPNPKHTPLPAPQPPSLEAQLAQAQADYKSAVSLEKEAGKEIKVQRANMMRLSNQILQRDEAAAALKRVRLENALDPKKALVITPVKVTAADIAAVR